VQSDEYREAAGNQFKPACVSRHAVLIFSERGESERPMLLDTGIELLNATPTI